MEKTYYYQKIMREYEDYLNPYCDIIVGNIFADLDDSTKAEMIESLEKEAMDVDYYDEEKNESPGNMAVSFVYPHVVVTVCSSSKFSYRENSKDFISKLNRIQLEMPWE